MDNEALLQLLLKRVAHCIYTFIQFDEYLYPLTAKKQIIFSQYGEIYWI